MRTILIVVMSLFLLAGCKERAVKKPAKLIDEEVMGNIFYDLAIIEGIRSRTPGAVENNNQYIYKKYKIDSLQFAQNNQYYASDIKQYQKIYEKVNTRLETEKKIADSLAKKSENLPAKPINEEEGVVK